MEKTEKFLSGHKLRASDIDTDELIRVFHSEMKKGLHGQESSLRMIPTYLEADNEFRKNTPVIAIDAGGTNFRCALVSFSDDGKLEMDGIRNHKMPGLDGEVTKTEFFDTMAGFIKPIVQRADRFGFCFSYPTEIFPDKDGKLLQFCKEVQAPEVIGQTIGKSLLDALGVPGRKIVLLNDTVATLLAGKSSSFNRTFDSYIGFILGTGTNICYVEANANIAKLPGLDHAQSMIINIESGNYNKAPRTDLDIAFDKTTMDPGGYTFEKMFSGGYFGGLCLFILKNAAKEGVFSDKATEKILQVDELTSEQANTFVQNTGHDTNILNSCFTSKEDILRAVYIIDNMINRSAMLVAASLAAVVLKTGKGTDPDRPVMITIEGTTFYRLFRLKERFEKYFFDILNGDRKRYVEFTEVSQSSLIGAALAGLTD